MNCCKNTAKPEGAVIAAKKAENGVYALLGLAQRAGRLVGGGDAVQKALAAGNIRLLLLAGDLSANAQKSLRTAWAKLPPKAKANAEVWRFGDKITLGAAVGKPPRGVWALADENFANGICQKLAMLAESGIAEKIEL